MISRLKRIFEDAVALASSDDAAAAEPALRRAAAALLVEMTHADHQVTEGERAAVARALRQAFELAPVDVEALLQAGETEARAATSLYEFTRELNRHFDAAQKVHFVEQLWRVAYADGELEKHEAHLVRKVANLLHLRHRDYIGAKLRAAEAVRLEP